MEFGIGNSRAIATLGSLEDASYELRKFESQVDIDLLEATVKCYGGNATHEEILGLGGDGSTTDPLSQLENECGWDIDLPLQTAVDEYYQRWDELDDAVYRLSNQLPPDW